MNLPRGTKIQENRQGAPFLTVLKQTENIIETYENVTIHVTKIRQAETDDGFYCRHWVDRRNADGTTTPRQTFVFVPK